MRQFIDDIADSTESLEDKISILQQMADQCPASIIFIRDGHFSANLSFYRLLGCTQPFHTVEDYLDACEKDFILYRDFSELLENASSFTRLYPITSFSGEEYYVENCTSVIQASDHHMCYVTFLIDRTECNRTAMQFDEFKEKYHVLEGMMTDYIFEYDRENDMLYFSEHWKPDGINTQYPHARKWLELHEIIHPDDLPYLLEAMNSTRIFKEYHVFEFRAKYSESEYSRFQIQYRLIRSKKTGHLRIIGKIGSADRDHRLDPNNKEKEGTDSLTGLLLPSYMQNRVDEALREEGLDAVSALMFLQVDNFAEIKKGIGDLFTNLMEKQVAQKLQTSFRSTDLLGYANDGCYTIFLRRVPEDIITMRAKGVLKAVQDIMINSATIANPTCSIGIAMAPADGGSYMELFLKADSAMYLSKARGGNTFSYFNTDVDVRQRTK